jgi:hypothetical protein
MKKKTITEIKRIFETKELIDDDTFEEWKKKKSKISLDNVLFAEMIIFCYTLFKLNITKTKIENKCVINDATKFISKIDIKELRKVYSKISNEGDLGKYYDMLLLSNIIERNREDYEELINVFFSIFEEEA